MKYIDVLFPLPVNSPYTYILPEEMENEIKIGQIVLAKVKTNYYSGIVVGIKNREQVNLNIKFIPISDIIEKESLVTKELIELSQWIAEYYISFWGEVVSLILPPGILQKSKKMVRLKQGADGQKTKINGTQKKIIEFIKDKNYVSLSSIKKKTKISNIHYHIQRLKELEILEEKSELSKKSAVKLFEYFYKLKETDEEKIKEILHPNAFLQKTAIEALRENYPQPLSQTYLNSIIDVSTTVLNRLRELKIIEREKKEVLRKLQWEININLAHLELNGAQQKVVDYFIPAVPEEKIEKNYTPALLWGVTGSGKTQVYIEIARKVLEAGRNVLILVPEISLTPQLISRFKFYLQQEVGAYHSKLSAGERFDIWRRVSRGELKIVVGARSAVFMPFKDIGLIVIDEEHEYSYKQTDTSPRYNARDVAMYIASKQKSIYITGSATPSMESLYLCKNNRMKLLQLNKRVKQLPLPRIHVTDLNHSALNEQDGSQLTENLLMEIQSRLLVKEQTLLFKNIRGYASYLQCEDCNSIIKCSKCDVTLTYHKKGKYLSCHYCGAEEPVLDVCPECRSYKLKNRGAGTEHIEEKLEKLFNKEVIRLDLDTTRKKNAYINKIEAFQRGKADLMVGTKMVTKGHDFPNLSLVGVLNADMEFSLPDFRATERGLQTLMQVTGRSGRNEIAGAAIVQTYMPDHLIFSWLKKHDYAAFSETELQNRELLNYPPYSRIILLRILAKEENEGMTLGKTIAEKLEKIENRKFEVLGPVFSPIKKIDDKYRVNIMLKIPREQNDQYFKLKTYLKTYLHPITVKNKNWKLYIDVDPVDIL